ncbi:unnamed protein product [Tilletia caries]|uniref:FCP1 homology domain-containing protein n=1 Tax=Tilletia caries TaxID=13290 RepID=A0A177V7A5_9BASI|nr:hypothetical protein CF336_g1972 [Tilletia laevis]KAE8256187.1 hypothetical protein A4X03_0g5454 [Tilletia caries]KAE8200100.1 hypothetical protein CF335_g4024 [Tilletia laevis]CAD6891101.1 unnamed protein product [Tilletia caries]CAD6934152.1 unnamed protein product [Tilletia caries]
MATMTPPSPPRPSAGLSRPYAISARSFAVPLTATQTPTEDHQHKKKKRRPNPPTPQMINPGMRNTIRPSYTRLASLPPQQTEAENPLLVLLDLNGTLLYRPNRASSSSTASANPIHRPYLRSFLLYALGIPTEHEEHLARTAKLEHSILHTVKDWSGDVRPNKKAKERNRLAAEDALLQLDALQVAPHHDHSAATDAGSPSETSGTQTTATQPQPAMSEDTHAKYGPWTPLPPSSSAKLANAEAHKPRLNLIIWSSAKPENVHRMARSIFLPTWDEPHPAPQEGEQEEDRLNTRLAAHVGIPPTSHSSVALLSRIQNIWSRDTLVPLNSPHYNNKVQCVKDLEIVWYALNVDDGSKAQLKGHHALEGRDQQVSGRLSALERQKQDNSRPDHDARDWEPAFAQEDPGAGTSFPQLGSTPGHGSFAAEAAHLSTLHGPWSPSNTLLLDDSPLKAALQPHNHLCVPEFDEVGAKRAKGLRQRLSGVYPDLDLWEQDVDLVLRGEGGVGEGEVEVDDVLLQLVGVLDRAKHQVNVAAWIRAGGLGGFGGGAGAGAGAGSIGREGAGGRRGNSPGVKSTVPSSPSSSSSASNSPNWRRRESGAAGAAPSDGNSVPTPTATTATAMKFVTAKEWARRGRAVLKQLGIPLLL